MRRIISLLFLLFMSNAAIAGNLCDAACNLTITFPDGGSIAAVEPLTITFGEAGYVNDGTATTGYAAGDTLILAAGESLVFMVGGDFDIGTDGNLEYTNLTINTNGVIEVIATGGSETISINNLTLNGSIEAPAEIISHSDTTVIEQGVLVVEDAIFTVADGASLTLSGTVDLISATLNYSGDIDGSGTTACDSSTETSSGSLTISNGSSVTATCSTVVLSSGVINGGVFTTGGGLIVTGNDGGTVTAGELTLIDNGSVTMAGDLVLTTLTKESLATFAGFEWLTSDGKTCTVTSEGDCITADGARYIVDDSGALVPEPVADGGAQLNLYLLLALFVLLPILRNQTARSKHFLHPKMLNAIK